MELNGITVYVKEDEGKLILYLMKNGFEITDSQYDDETDTAWYHLVSDNAWIEVNCYKDYCDIYIPVHSLSALKLFLNNVF